MSQRTITTCDGCREEIATAPGVVSFNVFVHGHGVTLGGELKGCSLTVLHYCPRCRVAPLTALGLTVPGDEPKA